jgi:hypothetical protein
MKAKAASSLKRSQSAAKLRGVSHQNTAMLIPLAQDKGQWLSSVSVTNFVSIV